MSGGPYDVMSVVIAAHCLRLGSIQKTNFSDNRLGGKCHPFSQLELTPEARILCAGRVHEYYLHVKYELQTPSISGRTVIILENQLSYHKLHSGSYLISNSDVLGCLLRYFFTKITWIGVRYV